ncbi:hypothetical protein MA03_03150 [Infirmifilum uzonense]|uniref:Uncharacterized protein n=1 Tax=Infirmifilum uzonense TaxID=1550241 RepID=A0A0F7FI72_9CREN|nr:hypothetical protein [Infirmifilum uzonense]AKG38475.1 hypothetical protein MA03_03150 [Infirmifilum uzonense]
MQKIFLLILILGLLALITEGQPTGVSEGAMLQYGLVVHNSSDFTSGRTPLVQLARERYEAVGLPLGRIVFDISMYKVGVVPGQENITSHLTESWEVPIEFCSTDKVEVVVRVLSSTTRSYLINYTVVFYNFTAVIRENNSKGFIEFLGEPDGKRNEYLVWTKKVFSTSRILLVDGSTGDTVDPIGRLSLGDWIFWLTPYDLSIGKSFILAGINYGVPAYGPNVTGFVGYLLLFNASIPGPRDYNVSGVRIERARTAIAFSYPVLDVYVKELRAGKVSDEARRVLQRFGCVVKEYLNSTVETNCTLFYDLVSKLKSHKAWRVDLVRVQTDPNMIRFVPVIGYDNVKLMLFPIDSFLFVYDLKAGILLEASHDSSLLPVMGYAPSYLSSYLAVNGYIPVFRSLSGVLDSRLTDTNVPLKATSLGSTGSIGSDAAYLFTLTHTALILLYYFSVKARR